jgi:general nucleoside transport system permease protein
MIELVSAAGVAQVLRIALPYMLASLAGVFSERGGVVNIALEGLLLTGAFGYVLGVEEFGSPAFGLLCGLAAGLLLVALLALVVVRFRADAVVAGVALNLLALGATKFLLKLVWDSSSNSGRVEAFDPLLDVAGPWGRLLAVLTNPLCLLAVLAVAGAPLLLYRTRFGLRLRACGEHPEAAATAGLSVGRLRLAGLLVSGALASLGGVWLASEQHQFTDGMSSGRGYVALAAMIVGRWRPVPAVAAALFFGLAETAQIALQGGGGGLPPQFLQMLPYALTVLVLVGFVGRATPPAALGRTERE